MADGFAVWLGQGIPGRPPSEVALWHRQVRALERLADALDPSTRRSADDESSSEQCDSLHHLGDDLYVRCSQNVLHSKNHRGGGTNWPQPSSSGTIQPKEVEL